MQCLSRTAFTGSKLGSSSVAPRRLSTVSAPTITCAYGDLPKIGGGRKWERAEINHNGNVVPVKMHVKKGDTVQVITGKDKGTVGTITRVMPQSGKIVVEGVNIKTKHIAPKMENETGQIKKMEFPLHHSNVLHYSKEKGVRSRVGHKILEDGRKVRFLVKTGEIID